MRSSGPHRRSTLQTRRRHCRWTAGRPSVASRGRVVRRRIGRSSHLCPGLSSSRPYPCGSCGVSNLVMPPSRVRAEREEENVCTGCVEEVKLGSSGPQFRNRQCDVPPLSVTRCTARPQFASASGLAVVCAKGFTSRIPARLSSNDGVSGSDCRLTRVTSRLTLSRF